MTPLDSSNLKGCEYDAENEVLTVHFRNGSTYQYQGVPPEIHEQLCNADSPGSFFHRAIRGRYAHTYA
ncbi:MAG: KTSC domain-containing protein [Verrucomicrobiota bacterium]